MEDIIELSLHVMPKMFLKTRNIINFLYGDETAIFSNKNLNFT